MELFRVLGQQEYHGHLESALIVEIYGRIAQ